jgi:hypothetical protein
MGQMATAIS